MSIHLYSAFSGLCQLQVCGQSGGVGFSPRDHQSIEIGFITVFHGKRKCRIFREDEKGNTFPLLLENVYPREESAFLQKGFCDKLNQLSERCWLEIDSRCESVFRRLFSNSKVVAVVKKALYNGENAVFTVNNWSIYFATEKERVALSEIEGRWIKEILDRFCLNGIERLILSRERDVRETRQALEKVNAELVTCSRLQKEGRKEATSDRSKLSDKIVNGKFIHFNKWRIRLERRLKEVLSDRDIAYLPKIEPIFANSSLPLKIRMIVYTYL